MTVKDVNEPPTGITISGSGILPANSVVDYKVGTLSVDDQDQGQSHMFSTKGSNSDLLKVRITVLVS